MRGLRLDDREVCTSELTHRAYRAVPCDLLLSVTPKNQAEALAAFRQAGALGGRYQGLRVEGVTDLSFLAEFPLLLYLELVGDTRVNTPLLDGLQNLRGLYLESPGAGVDFACFPELEVFSGGWHAGHRNFARARELRRLRLRNFRPQAADLSDLAHLTRLEDLELTQTTVTSLAGLETLEDLRYLEVVTASKLASLDALASPGCGVRELTLSKAKSIPSYRPLASVSHLRRLKLSSCASMPDLRWTAGLNRLDLFTFVETDVADGDLTPLLGLPRLRSVGTLDKRHYNMKCDALNETLARRNGGAGAEPTVRPT